MYFPWNRMESELRRELAHHLHELAAEYRRQGHSPSEAARLAKHDFGGSEQIKELCRDERRFAWLSGIRQDLTFAIRQMRRSPGFAVTAVITLALGIAANMIVFGVLQALVLRGLDLPRPDRVMTLGVTNIAAPFVAWPEVRDVRDANTVFSAVAAYAVENFGMEADGAARQVWGYEVSGQYFEVAGVKPFLGRLLHRTDDDHRGSSDAAVLSWPAWKTHFSGDRHIVGKTIRLNRQMYTVVGVTPEGFYGTEKFLQPDVFIPLANQPSPEAAIVLEQRRTRGLFSIVRLKDGVTLPQARSALATIAAGIRRQYPVDEDKLAFKLSRPGLIGDFIGRPARGFLVGVVGLAAIVLLAACANLGSLFAARTADRTREIAIRMAIGSSRWRILRQVLVEALAISIAGGTFACALAWTALTGLARWDPPSDYPIRFSVLPQPSLILVGLLISVAAGVLFGMIPLRQIFQTDPNTAMKNAGTQPFARGRWPLRDLLLAGQIALCCVTITAAFVSLRGLTKALTMDLGFKPQDAVLAKFDLGQAGYSSQAAERFRRQLLERVSSLPGVKTAAYANTTPLSLNNPSASVFSRETVDLRPSNKATSLYFFFASPGYFAAAGTPLLAGRGFGESDTPNSPAVAVVNQEFARRLFHTTDPVGQYFRSRSGALIQVVGIVADGKYLALSEEQQAAVFYPFSQHEATETSVVLSVTGDAVTTANAVRTVIREMDHTIPIREASPWTRQLGLAFFPSRVATVALSLFGAFGLLLSIAGTFGLASYTVSKRLRDLSIRVALGAEAKQIVQAALGRMLLLLASGSVVGVALGVAATRVLSAIVYDASAQDPLVLGAVVAAMLLTGSLSVAGPVRRALQLDPARLLREQ